MLTITSKQNDTFRRLMDLLTPKGSRQQGEALIFGLKVATEVARDFPGRTVGWVTREDHTDIIPAANAGTAMGGTIALAAPLFRELDLFGTEEPILRITVPAPDQQQAPTVPPQGVALVVPFQHPDNVGAMIRTAAALGVARIYLTEEAAWPYHPKAVRAAAGAMLRVPMVRLPALSRIEFPWSSTIGLTAGAADIRQLVWPQSGILVPGLEGPGLPERIRAKAGLASIPMAAGVESLNGMVAASIALYEWTRHLQ